MTSTTFLQVPQSGQKFIKNANNSQFWRFFLKPEACSQKLKENPKFEN